MKNKKIEITGEEIQFILTALERRQEEIDTLIQELQTEEPQANVTSLEAEVTRIKNIIEKLKGGENK